MKFSEWRKYVEDIKNRGGIIDTDGYYGGQCMDLYNHYMNNVVGVKNAGADCAKNILNNKDVISACEVIRNYDTFVPQKGDVAVWTGTRYGHCAVCTGEKSNINNFESIDQNWVEQTITIERHNYITFAPIYFLRPKNQSNIIEQAPKKDINEIAKEVIRGDYGNGDDRVNALKNLGYTDSDIDNIQQKVNEILNNQPDTVKNINIEELAYKVIRGEYGNGDDRVRNLQNEGYTLEEIDKIQQKVNELL